MQTAVFEINVYQLAGYLIIQLAAIVWWASSIHSSVHVLKDGFKGLGEKIDSLGGIIFTKDDANRELQIADHEHKAIHKRIDRLEERVLQ
jgi:hypothetical protein